MIFPYFDLHHEIWVYNLTGPVEPSHPTSQPNPPGSLPSLPSSDAVEDTFVFLLHHFLTADEMCVTLSQSLSGVTFNPAFALNEQGPELSSSKRGLRSSH